MDEREEEGRGGEGEGGGEGGRVVTAVNPTAGV